MTRLKNLIRAWQSWRTRRISTPRTTPRKKNSLDRATIGARQVNSAYHRRVPVLGELGTATSGQLLSTSPSILIPLGSTQQHGPHLPLDSDTRIATAVARAVAAPSQWLGAPPTPHPPTPQHHTLPLPT